MPALGIGIGVPFGRSGAGIDADAALWAAAVTANGGTYSASHLTAVSNAIRDRKVDELIGHCLS